ncbi:hypothetical protein [Demequina sp.]|uniref:hypothetical protein n=1 Tax=Demequina sp. TaxID=2050685 RepID=UPI0025BD17BE|nr:hypothetical protein [Demequina sp.]
MQQADTEEASERASGAIARIATRLAEGLCPDLATGHATSDPPDEGLAALAARLDSRLWHQGPRIPAAP